MPQQVQEWQVTKPWLNKNCALGEGPFYEQETDSLRFVDIKKKQLLYVKDISAVSAQETAPEPEILQLDVCPTVTSDIEGVDPRERILLGTKYGIEVLNRKTGKHDLLVPFGEPHNERVRGNDGAADPLGGFLLGTMTDFGQGEVQPEGQFFDTNTASCTTYTCMPQKN
jgi:sugar lactone lactonase YvrE